MSNVKEEMLNKKISDVKIKYEIKNVKEEMSNNKILTDKC